MPKTKTTNAGTKATKATKAKTDKAGVEEIREAGFGRRQAVQISTLQLAQLSLASGCKIVPKDGDVDAAVGRFVGCVERKLRRIP